MISTTGVFWLSVALYVGAFVGLVAWLRRIPTSRRPYCYPVVVVVGFAAAMTALSALGVGVFTVNGSELDVPGVLDDLVAYSTLWMVAAFLVTDSRRTLATLAAVSAIQVLSFNVASVVGGVVGIVGLLVVVGGHGLVGYLMLGPIWDRADAVPKKQRLLHWKSRNLLLFLIGMLIAYALLSVGGVFDEFVRTVLAEYIALLIRVGFAGFLFANVGAIDPDLAGLEGALGGQREETNSGAPDVGLADAAVTTGDTDD